MANKKEHKLIRVKSPVKKDVSIMVASELEDDKLIGQELLGESLETLVYEIINDRGESEYSLSYPGVREAVRVINRDKKSGHMIQVSDRPPIVNRVSVDGQDGIEIMIYAQDIESGSGSWGMKFEPWNKITEDGKIKKNRFAMETAISKAQRNAMLNLLPAHLIQEMINKFISENKNAVKTIKAKSNTIDIKKMQETDTEILYQATLDRIGEFKDKKTELNKILKKVDNMPLNSKQKGSVRRKIKSYLARIEKNGKK